MTSLFDFNTVLGKILFVIIILAATQINLLAGVGVLLLIISMNHKMIEGMENKTDSSTDSVDHGDSSKESSRDDNTITDLNGDDADKPISTFKTDFCKSGLLMKDDKEVTAEMITKSFPQLKFSGESCNPCDNDCKFEIISSNERLTAEENVSPVDSTTIPVDRETATKKQDEQ